VVSYFLWLSCEATIFLVYSHGVEIEGEMSLSGALGCVRRRDQDLKLDQSEVEEVVRNFADTEVLPLFGG
jgi:hypothetical protein